MAYLRRHFPTSRENPYKLQKTPLRVRKLKDIRVLGTIWPSLAAAGNSMRSAGNGRGIRNPASCLVFATNRLFLSPFDNRFVLLPSYISSLKSLLLLLLILIASYTLPVVCSQTTGRRQEGSSIRRHRIMMRESYPPPSHRPSMALRWAIPIRQRNVNAPKPRC